MAKSKTLLYQYSRWYRACHIIEEICDNYQRGNPEQASVELGEMLLASFEKHRCAIRPPFAGVLSVAYYGKGYQDVSIISQASWPPLPGRTEN